MDGVVHFEIPATDMDRAKAFYQTIFGWKAVQFSSDYCVVQTQPVDENRMPLKPGMINGALQARNSQITMPRIVINVDDIDQKVKTIEQNGGKLLQPKTEVPNMLYYAVVLDTEGNELGLVQPFMKN